MKKETFNLKKFLQLVILAAFLFSWSCAANATVLCQCEEGHITVENIYTGYCDLDLNHDHSVPGHSDLSCDCEDTPIYMGTSSLTGKIDFNFDLPSPTINTELEYKIVSLDQNHIAYVLSKERLSYSIHDELSTIILLI